MAEITIRGAGIMGLMCAWVMTQRGMSVQVVDPNGVAAGASGGIVGALAPHVPENWNPKKAMQFDALDRAASLWAEIARVGGRDPGYGRTGRIQPLSDKAAIDLARQRSETAKLLWRDRYSWTVVEEADIDIHVHSPTGHFVQDTLTARIHPKQACLSLASALAARQVPILACADTKGVEIWATGTADLVEISRSLGKAIGAPIKGQAALLECAMPKAPQIFADGLHIVPHANGTVAIGSTTEREFEDPTATDAQLDALIATARQVVPALADAGVIQRWAGLRPRARSRAPMVGVHPTRPGTYIANGGFKIGLAMAPVVAEMLADLILDGQDRIPESFRPEASL